MRTSRVYQRIRVCMGIGNQASEHGGTASPDGDPRPFVTVGLMRAHPTGVFPYRHELGKSNEEQTYRASATQHV